MDARTDANRSSLGRLALLALTFVAGYLLGSQRAEPSAGWQNEGREPTEITIEDGQGGTPEGSEENGE